MRRMVLILWLCFSCFTIGITEPAWAAHSREFAIRPDVLDIGTFYSGGRVNISGEVSDGQDVIIEIAGPAVNDQFDIKGRVGPFWMNRDKAEMDGAPSMYALFLPGGPDWERKASSLGLGFDMLKRKMAIQSAALSTDDLFHMFLELKKDQGLYVEKTDAVTYAPAEDGRRQFSTVYYFPRSTSAGIYTIKATTIANGVKIKEQSHRFTVDEVGFIRLVDDLATNRRLGYGILAVVIALFTGALMGLLFKGGGSH